MSKDHPPAPRSAARVEAAREEARKTLHALNNALSIVSTFAATLAEEVEDGSAREAVDEIVRAARRAGELSRRLGDALRQTEGEDPDQGRT